MSRGRGRAISEDDEQPVGLRPGRWTVPFTQAPDWVLLAPVSKLRHPAKLLYWALASHVNVKDGTLVVNPTMAQLADMLGYSRRDKLLPYFDELAAFGAIDIETELVPGRGNIKRNSYVVHQDPPEGYAGPLSLGDFHRDRKARKRAQAAAKESAVANTPTPVDNSPSDDPQTLVTPGLESAPCDESAGDEPYPISGTAAVPQIGYGTRTRFEVRDNKTNKQDDWNKSGGRTAAPRPPADLTAGHVDHWVTSETELVSNQQTACAETGVVASNSQAGAGNPVREAVMAEVRAKFPNRVQSRVCRAPKTAQRPLEAPGSDPATTPRL